VSNQIILLLFHVAIFEVLLHPFVHSYKQGLIQLWHLTLYRNRRTANSPNLPH
jgi:hypothetical protein